MSAHRVDPVEAARRAGAAVRSWLFAPEGFRLMAAMEHDADGRAVASATRYAVHDEVDLPCALLTESGDVAWKDDDWRERRGCFVAGTPVWTAEGMKPIEQIELGARVRTANGPRLCRAAAAMAATLLAGALPGAAEASVLDVAEPSAALTANSESWRQIHVDFSADDDPEHTYSIELLRPASWLADREAREVGDRFRLELDELRASGWATVTAVHEATAPSASSGVVTMRLSHVAGSARPSGYLVEGCERSASAAEPWAKVGPRTGSIEGRIQSDVYELSFEKGTETLRGTGVHPLYSLDRDDWVRIRDLQLGERLQTAEGAVTVEALEKVREEHRVYNLEVLEVHEYFVGGAVALVHNAQATGTCFRGDDDYAGGDIGAPSSPITAEDLILHVKGKRPKECLTSWSTKRANGASSRGASFFSDNIVKADAGDAIGEWIDPDDAYALIEGHPKKKVRRLAPEVRQTMKKNNEVILNGVMPGESIRSTR